MARNSDSTCPTFQGLEPHYQKELSVIHKIFIMGESYASTGMHVAFSTDVVDTATLS